MSEFISDTSQKPLLITGTVVVALVLVMGVPSVLPVGQAVAQNDAPTTPVDDSFDRGSWIPQTTVDVNEDGTATVTRTVLGETYPDRVRLTDRAGNVNKIIEGEAALEKRNGFYNWDTTESDRVVYEVELGVVDRPVNTGVFDNAVLFAAFELLPLSTSGYDELPAAHRYTINGPDGWAVAAPGYEVETNTFDLTPQVAQDRLMRSMFFVGDTDVVTASDGERTYRIVDVPSADPGYTPADVGDLMLSTAPVLEDAFDIDDPFPRLAIIGPQNFETGGIAQGYSFLVNENDPLYDVDTASSTYVHEQTHTYQRFWFTAEHAEPQASYLQMYALYEAGEITWEEYRQMLLNWVTEDGEPVRATVEGDGYFKGAAAYAALDVDIRARTDGKHDITDFIGPVSDRREDLGGWRDNWGIPDELVHETLENLTEKSYTGFFESYVNGESFPQILLSDAYDLDTPQPVPHDGEHPVTVSNITVPRKTVVDEPVDVSFQLDHQDYTETNESLTVQVGDQRETETVLLAGQEDRTVSIPVRTDSLESGLVGVQVRSETDQGIDALELVEPERPAFNITVEAGETVRLNTSVSNEGESRDTQEISFSIAGETVDSTAITLDRGQRTHTSMKWTPEAGGTTPRIYYGVVASTDRTAYVGVEVTEPSPTVGGTVSDTDEEGLAGVAVTFVDTGTQESETTVTTGENGTYSADLTAGTTYEITAKADGYESDTAEITVESNKTYTVDFTLSNTGAPPAVGSTPPRDLNGDGLYRDIDGDSEFDVFDVQMLFTNLDSDAVQNHPAAYNFAGEDDPDSVTVFDVQALFDDLQSGVVGSLQGGVVDAGTDVVSPRSRAATHQLTNMNSYLPSARIAGQ